jgi:hypothetical protein
VKAYEIPPNTVKLSRIFRGTMKRFGRGEKTNQNWE